MRRIWRKRFAFYTVLEQHHAVPVNYDVEKVYSSRSEASRCGVLNRNGIFYVSLKIQGQEVPVEVALHGVRSELEARQALATFSTLPFAECAQAKP